mgnify:CR=1 FL=1
MHEISIITLLFGSGILVRVGHKLYTSMNVKIKKNEEETAAVCLGVQALLRDRLLWSYNHYNEKGYAPIYAKENFENMYQQYHALGANGVMDEVYEKFKALPLEKEV